MAQQDLKSPHSGIMSTITPGDPMDRSMGQYGKAGTPMTAMVGGLPTPGSDPTKSMGDPTIKDGTGGIKSHPKFGGIGPGMSGGMGTSSPMGNFGVKSDAG
jgi:hypothetical protein